MWFLRLFFLLIACCLAGGLFLLARNLLSKPEKVSAVVLERKKQAFPASLVGIRREKYSYEVSFGLTGQEQKKVTLEVSELAFKGILPGAEGVLSYKGGWFISFTDEWNIVTKKEVLSRGNAELF